MTDVFIGVGSNVTPQHYIQQGLRALQQNYGTLLLSPTYQSAAINFTGAAFYNLVVGFESNEPAQAIMACLKRIETDNDRQRLPETHTVTLDLDLLLYGDKVSESPPLPHHAILHHAFVLRPLADIAPTAQHPIVMQTYATLWAHFAAEATPLKPLKINWEI